MQKLKYSKMGIVACIAVLMTCLQVRAVDMAWASSVLADVAVAATQANAALADAAASGDAKAVSQAQAQVEAVKAAMEDALQAFEAIAQAGTDEAAAQAGADSLTEALDDALAALGSEPTSIPTPGSEDAGDTIPNPYDVLWQSEGLREIYQELFNTVNAASAQGGADFPENDATRI